MPTNKTKLNMPLKRKTKRFIFALLMVALPVIQFSILYVYKNANSILLAFQTYQPNYNSIGYDVSFAGFEEKDAPSLKSSISLYIEKVSADRVSPFSVQKKSVSSLVSV